jgi:ribonuclease P protein component
MDTPATSQSKLERLKRRAQFLAVAQGRSAARGAIVVQALPQADDPSLIRVGFTATKRIGGSVVRNRAKRRMREAARALLPLHGLPGCDYVFVARAGAPTRPWERLLDDVKSALISLAAGGDDPRPPRQRPPSGSSSR